tara:strand:+ start:1613 stop:2065 length:453 start_codon:yes stop_codon:yes gene_type:complete
MGPKKKRSIGLLIRRFLAGYILLSVVVQLIKDISEGEFSNRSLDDLFFGLLIVFFLAFYSRKKKVDQEPEEELEQPTINTNYEDTENIDILDQEDIQSYNEDIEIENLETQNDEVDIKTEDVNQPSGYNPVKDNEGIFSRLFKGRNNRYG